MVDWKGKCLIHIYRHILIIRSVRKFIRTNIIFCFVVTQTFFKGILIRGIIFLAFLVTCKFTVIWHGLLYCKFIWRTIRATIPNTISVVHTYTLGEPRVSTKVIRLVLSVCTRARLIAALTSTPNTARGCTIGSVGMHRTYFTVTF